MRIITKFKDYYDGLVRSSVNDQSLTFVRTRVEHDISDVTGDSSDYSDYRSNSIHHSFINYDKHAYGFTTGVVGFCGKIYPYVRIDVSLLVYPTEPEVHYAYTLEEFKKFVPFSDDDVKRGNRSSWSTYWGRSRIIAACRGHLEYGNVSHGMWRDDGYDIRKDSHYVNYFYKHKIAYYQIQSGLGCVIYPRLTECEFYKVFEPYACFQEIEMYLTNELVKPDEITVVIPDDMKAQSKGYNRFSFRKDPNDSKKPRVKKRKNSKDRHSK